MQPLDLDFSTQRRPAGFVRWLVLLAGVAALAGLLAWNALAWQPRLTAADKQLRILQSSLTARQPVMRKMSDEQLAAEWRQTTANVDVLRGHRHAHESSKNRERAHEKTEPHPGSVRMQVAPGGCCAALQARENPLCTQSDDPMLWQMSAPTLLNSGCSPSRFRSNPTNPTLFICAPPAMRIRRAGGRLISVKKTPHYLVSNGGVRPLREKQL